MLPAFHNERMERLRELVAESVVDEVDSWPRGEVIALHQRLQRLTLEIILRAVFGLEPGPGMNKMHELLTEFLAFGENSLSLLSASPLSFLADHMPGSVASRWAGSSGCEPRSTNWSSR
jgi:cytochrome P450